MRYLASHERAVRGTFDFPIALYYVDPQHPRYEMPFHWHMEHELILVLSGTFALSLNGEPFTLSAGDCALVADGSTRRPSRTAASTSASCSTLSAFCRN